jgi:hypothetical protein
MGTGSRVSLRIRVANSQGYKLPREMFASVGTGSNVCAQQGGKTALAVRGVSARTGVHGYDGT